MGGGFRDRRRSCGGTVRSNSEHLNRLAGVNRLHEKSELVRRTSQDIHPLGDTSEHLGVLKRHWHLVVKCIAVPVHLGKSQNRPSRLFPRAVSGIPDQAQGPRSSSSGWNVRAPSLIRTLSCVHWSASRGPIPHGVPRRLRHAAYSPVHGSAHISCSIGSRDAGSWQPSCSAPFVGHLSARLLHSLVDHALSFFFRNVCN